jgi:hypothetical protein
MKLNINNNQLNSLFEQLNVSKNKGQSNLQKTMAELNKQARQLKETSKEAKAKETPKDKLDLSQASKQLSMAELKQSSLLSQTEVEYTDDRVGGADEAQSVQAGGYNISFQFDLFYELTSKVEAQMGQRGAERFVSLGASVAETFQSSFSLSIDPVGSFMNGTQESLELSPEVTNSFFDAVEKMSSLSPEALENFLSKSDDFFAELKKTYGDAEGAFDAIKDTMQSQAKNFFAQVKDMKDSVLGAPEGQIKGLEEGAKAEPLKGKEKLAELGIELESPSKLDTLSMLLDGSEKDDDSLISMFFNKDVKLSQDQYSDFLQDFQGFANKIKGAMFGTLFDSSQHINKGGFNISA